MAFQSSGSDRVLPSVSLNCPDSNETEAIRIVCMHVESHVLGSGAKDAWGMTPLDRARKQQEKFPEPERAKVIALLKEKTDAK